MEKTENIKQMSRAELEQKYMEMSTKVEQLSQENAWYQEQIKLQQKKLFGKSSEKVNSDQLSLFDEAEVESTPINNEINLTELKAHTGKRKTKRLNPDELKNTTIDYVLSDEEMSCPKCGHNLHEMSTHIRRELIFIPAKVEVINHVEHIYSCRYCENNDIEATIVKADGPAPLINGSIASASLVANIINDKYEKALPLYRQEVTFMRMGININRQNMSNWIIKVANSYFKAMVKYMTRQLLMMEYISADETPVQVLHEPGKAASTKSYMWVYMSGRSESKQMVIYNYEQSRAHKHAVDYLKEYSGILLSDGYQAYDKIDNIVQAGCWVHVRRKFNDALELIPKNTDKKETQTYKCMQLIKKLFKIESANKDKKYDGLTIIRQRESLPVVDEFFQLLQELKGAVLPKSHLGVAVTYALNQEEKLRTYLNDGRIEISNNVTERAIRPFTIGRNNWLFMNTVKGADSSSYIYSLVESAKLNNLKPYDYFNYILSILPGKDMNDEKLLESVMPWAKLPKELYNTKKS